MATMQPEPRAAGRRLMRLSRAAYLWACEYWLQLFRLDPRTNEQWELQDRLDEVDREIDMLESRLNRVKEMRSSSSGGEIVVNAIVRAVIRVSAFANSVITAWQAGRRDKQPNHSS